MTNYAFFSQSSDRWGKDLALFWGHLNICPSLQQFHITSITQSELSSLTGLKAWGDKEKFHDDIAFLLVSAEEEVTGDRKYGLSTIWVNPSQARVPSMEEAVRELTAWVSNGPNWPYTLVQLNVDTCHAPLPKGAPRCPAQRRHWQCHLWKNWPTGDLPASHLGSAGHLPGRAEWTWGSYHNLPAQAPGQWHKPNWKQICLFRGGPPATHHGGARPESIAPWQMPLILMASPIKTTPLKPEREVSMTMEVRSLLSRVMLDMTGHMSENPTPTRPNPVVVLTPPPHKLRDLSGPVDTSSQVSTPDDSEMAGASLEEIPTAISHS